MQTLTFGVILLSAIALSAPASANSRKSASYRTLWAFCPRTRLEQSLAFRGAVKTITNRDRKSVASLLGLPPNEIKIESKSADWKNESEAVSRIQEVLNSKPKALTSLPLWAEQEGFAARDIVANLDKNGAGKIESADYHICIRDEKGRFWYFRTVAADDWVK